jgi:hypothetical protein
MQIKAAIKETTDLELTAATFSPTEFRALRHVLAEAGVGGILRRVQFTDIGPDRAGRMVRQYLVPKRPIESLERVLGGHFDPSGLFTATAAAGRSYSCREVVVGGHGPGCEDVTAANDYIALSKCALIAGRNLWFGGESKAGTCSEPSTG